MTIAPISLSAPGRSVPPLSPARPAGEMAASGPETRPLPVVSASVPALRVEEPSEESLRKVVEAINEKVRTQAGASVQFEVNYETGDVRIRVVDKQTQEVIRFIPPEGLFEIIASQSEIKGLLVNSQG
ncbi:MAG: hypothetical protein DYH08_16720 [Actinobacteria bacterium ATB1]|nr:hypothetical protein [Actinobacteria bacterium ATB1]